MYLTAEDLSSAEIIFEQKQVDRYTPGQFELRLYQPPDSEEAKAAEKRLLSLNGITLADRKSERPFKLLRFALSQWECFGLWQARRSSYAESPLLLHLSKPRWRFLPLPTETWTKDVRKGRELACRALYILGFEVGLVEVAIFRSKPRYRLWRIDRRLPMQAKSAFLQLIEKQRLQFYRSSSVVLGADLELVLRHRNGKYLLASTYFSKHGRVGYDAIWLPGQRQSHPILELRPKESEEPRQLLKNIYLCLLRAVRKIDSPDVEILSGGKPLRGFPIGGHIHFSNLSLNSRLIRALDNYLAFPLFLMESEVSLTRRPKYGFLGDVREQFHGGFEYRTPPSWLARPRLARGVLCLAKVLAHDYRSLVWMPLNNLEVQNYFYHGEQEKSREIVQQLWHELSQRCPSYAKYREELDQFYQLIESHYKWNEYQDIRPSWKLG